MYIHMYMHLDRRVRARVVHVFSINPRELSHPRLAHTIYNRPRPFSSFALSSPPVLQHLLFRFFLAADVTAVFPPSFLALLFTRSPFLAGSQIVGSLPVRHTQGTWRLQLYATHIAYGPRRSATQGEGLKRRRVYYDFGVTSSFFFISFFRSFVLSLFLFSFSSSLCYKRSW